MRLYRFFLSTFKGNYEDDQEDFGGDESHVSVIILFSSPITGG